jgi:CelD/BcsL family acetyltransferase involved in cellulose biosynthesis
MTEVRNLIVREGEPAVSWLLSEDAQAKWRALHARCTWSTAFQSPDFVLPWYSIYRNGYLPVIIYAEADNGELDGLLMLGLDKRRNRLVGTGDAHAEYHCWLAPPEDRNAFIMQSLAQIERRYPNANLILHYLAPNTPVDWISRMPGGAGRYRLKSVSCPIMRVDAESAAAQRRKKRHRWNYNRLSRHGELVCERVVDHARFLEVFDDICVHVDLRKGAMFNVTPFTSDPLEKPFKTELHRRGILHTTVMRLNGQVIASHYGIGSQSTLVLGTVSYAPWLSAYSPGALHMAMLAMQLAKEKVVNLDLTPGNDEYKEMYATDSMQIFSLRKYGRLRAYLSDQTKDALRRGVAFMSRRTSIGIDPRILKTTLQRVAKMREIGMGGVARQLHGRLAPVGQYYRTLPPPAHAGIAPAKHSCLADLLRFDPRGAGLSRQDFFSLSLRKLTDGCSPYTIVLDGTLILCCWVTELSGTADDEHGTTSPRTGRVFVLSDIYVHPVASDDELAAQFVNGVLDDIHRRFDAIGVWLVGRMHGRQLAHAKKWGFEPAAAGTRLSYSAVAEKA